MRFVPQWDWNGGLLHHALSRTPINEHRLELHSALEYVRQVFFTVGAGVEVWCEIEYSALRDGRFD